MSRTRTLAAAAVLGASTLMSRCTGLIRDIVIATMFGAGFGTDAFFIAFTIPNLLRRFFAEGSLTAAFVPVFSGVRHSGGHPDAVRVARQCWSLLLLVMAVVTALGVLCAPWIVNIVGHGFGSVPGKMLLTIDLTRTMFPYIFFVSLLALATGILNVYGHFFIPALSPVLLNLSIICSALFFSSFFAIPIEALAWGVVVGGILQLLVTLPILKRYGFSLRPVWRVDHPAVKRIALLMLPGVLGVAIYQINMVVTRLLASFLEQGSVSYLYYSQRLFEFPQGIFIASLAQALLPTMSQQAAAREESELLGSLQHALSLIFIITIPASVGLALCSQALFSQLFMRGAFTFTDVNNTAIALVAYAPGLVFVGISRVIVPLFHAWEDTRTPVYVSFWTLLVNGVGGLVLMQYYAYVGLAAALTLASLFNALVLFILMRRNLGRNLEIAPLGGVFVKACAASAVMGVVVYAVLHYGSWSVGFTLFNALILAFAVCAGALVYTVAGWIMGLREISEVVGMLKRRIRR
ncbi:MAG: murein biosynthesis integral membrane protein MurJ [Desulfuromonadaceae bacterium]